MSLADFPDFETTATETEVTTIKYEVLSPEDEENTKYIAPQPTIEERHSEDVRAISRRQQNAIAFALTIAGLIAVVLVIGTITVFVISSKDTTSVTTYFTSTPRDATLLYFKTTSATQSANTNGYIYLEKDLYKLTDNELSTMHDKDFSDLILSYLDLKYYLAGHPEYKLKFNDDDVNYAMVYPEFREALKQFIEKQDQ